jgi:hypothetical protein
MSGLRGHAALLLAVLILQLGESAAVGAELSNTEERPQLPGLTSEFIYRNTTDEVLIPVYLLGAVAKPGMYHIPANMDLVGLLTIAGGPVPGARVDHILVESQNTQGPRKQEQYNLEEAVKGERPLKLALASNDLVYVTPGKPAIPAELVTVISLVTGVLAIVATSLAISNSVKSNH